MHATASETMESIRFLLNKHLRVNELNAPMESINTISTKEYVFKQLDSITLAEAKRLCSTALSCKEIARRMGLSSTTISQIRNNHQKYRDMPDTPDAIDLWRAARKQASRDRRRCSQLQPA